MHFSSIKGQVIKIPVNLGVLDIRGGGQESIYDSNSKETMLVENMFLEHVSALILIEINMM